jgi:hypothetical protein
MGSTDAELVANLQCGPNRQQLIEKTLFTCTAPGRSWYTCGAERLSFSRRSKKLPPERILTLSTANALAVSESLALRAATACGECE